jgi:hypothetical protein
MCMACEMEAMWFAAMEARARAVAAEALSQATQLPPPEEGGGSPQAEVSDHNGEPTARFACDETQAE